VEDCHVGITDYRGLVAQARSSLPVQPILLVILSRVLCGRKTSALQSR
jgi:hypothetical protein